MVGDLFQLFGGLGLFLYGMQCMTDGMQKSMGRKMQRLLRKITDNRLLGVLIGTAITTIIQSSSATTVMVVGFVNAGILNLLQAVGVIMGANIGTTMTAWLVSLNQVGSYFKPEFYAPLFVGVGAFYILLAKREHTANIGHVIIGFGMLFVGLSFMSSAIKPYQDLPIFKQAFVTLGHNPVLGILVGLFVTAIIQSSSASVGILQTLALSGHVNLRAALFITLGQNIGTCVTALLASIGTQRNAKRAAIIHVLFNVIGAILFGFAGYILFMFQPDFGNMSVDPVKISIFHTFFNITNTIILFPFAKQLVKLSEQIVHAGNTFSENEDERLTQVLDIRLLENPAFALQSVHKEIAHMGQLAISNVKAAMHAILHDDGEIIPHIYETERAINRLEERVGEYLVKIENHAMSESMHSEISHLYYTLNDLERIGDHAENLAHIFEQLNSEDICISDVGKEDLHEISRVTIDCIIKAVEAREKMEREKVFEVRKLEAEVDKLEEIYRADHLQRMVEGRCGPAAGVHFLDVIANLERISDHADNIASYVGEELQSSNVFVHAEHAEQRTFG